jgi:hypothetical protein
MFTDDEQTFIDYLESCCDIAKEEEACLMDNEYRLAKINGKELKKLKKEFFNWFKLCE